MPLEIITVGQLVDATMFNALTGLIDAQELSAAQASVTFSSIPQTFEFLTVIASCASTSASPGNLLLRMNGDAGASNYYHTKYYAKASTVQVSETIAAAQIEVGGVNGTGAPVGTMSVATIDIHSYTRTGAKPVAARWSRQDGTATQNTFAGLTGGAWKGTAAVTSLTLLPSIGSFAAGSVFSLYGWG